MSRDGKRYISQRVIDACLRENLFGILDRGRIVPTLPPSAPAAMGADVSDHWLVLQSTNRCLYVPVRPSRHMQPWRAASDGWLAHNGRDWRWEQGYGNWLGHLAEGRGPEVCQSFARYCEEANTAVRHYDICRDAYRRQRQALARPIGQISDWHQRMLFGEQLASYLDHPFYPTARAKHGLDGAALEQYAPEFMATFSLRWVAIKNARATQIGTLPPWWPDCKAVGLPADYADSHTLFPVHPLTWPHLQEMADDMVRAPLAAVEVQPSLSVRTVAVKPAPRHHLKLPLTMSTLGARNTRLIKPSTLYDGHLVGQMLRSLAESDPRLRGRYLHCHEETGGHVGNSRQLCYMIREYPEQALAETTPVPVAALASPLPDGRLYVEHLVDAFYGGDLHRWLDEYLELLLGVHLRLWLVYGIALEANQQNSVLVYEAGQPLRLLMKDNDSGRLLYSRCSAAAPELAGLLEQVRDRRLLAEDDLALAQMFCTIILQLNIAAVIEALGERNPQLREPCYARLRQKLRSLLLDLSEEGVDISPAEDSLLNSDRLYVKYLLSAGSLFDKQQLGTSDINKYYGLSCPNFLREH
ncbi:IucA/IucC family protein [Porticoccus sp.]